MDFRLRPRQRIEIKLEHEELAQKYMHNIMFYRLPPTDDLKLQEFEELALQRLSVLRILERAQTKGLRLLSDEYKEYVLAELNTEGLKGYARLIKSSGVTMSTAAAASASAGVSSKQEAELQARRRDYISHFILRLAYSRTEDLKRWFITREMELFRLKLSVLSSAEIKQFIELNNLGYVPLSEEQKDMVKDGLYESTMNHSVAKIEMLEFYKVPFIKVLDLVRTRRCYLKAGFAYINTLDLVSIIATIQQDEIEQGLQSAQRHLRQIETDERVEHFIKSIHTSYSGKDFTISKAGEIPIESLDQLSRKSFPLCMRTCHEHLRTHHHLKHNGRLQYTLFLKGIGVSLEGALRFWREEFTKKIDHDTFTKRYEYNVYHTYGKRGSMVNYTPYSCLKVIQESGVAGDANGCPYKNYDALTLKNKLAANGLSAAHAQEIVSFAQKGHYQLACGKYFQYTHGIDMELNITHPNQYFEDSQNIMGARGEKQNEKQSMKRKVPANKRNANSTNTTLLSADDDDELWSVAETEESAYKSQLAEKSAWDEDLDLTQIDTELM